MSVFIWLYVKGEPKPRHDIIFFLFCSGSFNFSEKIFIKRLYFEVEGAWSKWKEHSGKSFYIFCRKDAKLVCTFQTKRRHSDIKLKCKSRSFKFLMHNINTPRDIKHIFFCINPFHWRKIYQLSSDYMIATKGHWIEYSHI